MAAIPLDLFRRPTLDVARELLGVELVYDGCGGVIVETEAYTDDPASHFVTRPNTGRLLGESWGRIYLYTIYGVHRCLNITSDAHGPGAVLIRALEPTLGLDRMRLRRGVQEARALTSGPAKLYQALGIPADLHGQPATVGLALRRVRRLSEEEVIQTPRIGISRAAELHWRFIEQGSPFLSR